MSLSVRDNSGSGQGSIAVSVLPDIAGVRQGDVYRRTSDETFWTRNFNILPAEAATDASITTANFSTVVISTHTWFQARDENPYPADAAGVYWNIDDESFYIKAAGSLAGSLTTEAPTFNALYNYKGAFATEPADPNANNDIYFNTTDGNWYIYVTNRYSNVAAPHTLFAGTNAVWLAPPLDTQAEILEHFYTQTYSSTSTYYFYDSTAGIVVALASYTPTTTDWATAPLANVSTLSGASAYFTSEADAIEALEDPDRTLTGIDILILNTAGDDLLLMTAFMEATPFIPEREDPFWAVVSQDFVRGPDPNAFTDNADRDANVDTAPYDDNQFLLISVDDEVQRRVAGAWITVSGWVAGRTGDRGLTGPEPNDTRLNSLITPLLMQAITDNNLQDDAGVTTIVNTILNARNFQSATQVMTAITNALTAGGYQTSAEVMTAITNALADYSTTTNIGTLITTALADYRTETQIQALINTAIQGLMAGGSAIIQVQYSTDGTTYEDPGVLTAYRYFRVRGSDSDTWKEIDLGSMTGGRQLWRGPYANDVEYMAGDMVWEHAAVYLSRIDSNMGNDPIQGQRSAQWDPLSGRDVTQIEKFFAREERTPDATTSYRIQAGTTAGEDGIIEANPTARWYDRPEDIPISRRHLTLWSVLVHSKNNAQLVIVESPEPFTDPDDIAKSRAEIESNFPVLPLDSVPHFANFAHWGISRAASAEEGIDIADITFVDANDTVLESDVTFESNHLGRLSLYELGARASRLRTANNTVGRISIRVSALYASVVGTIQNSPSKLNVTGTGYIEIAFSIEHTHIEWTTVAPNGEPLGRAEGTVTLTEESPATTSTHAYVVSARVEPSIGQNPMLRFGTADGSLAIYAQDVLGIRFQSDGFDYPTPRGDWSTEVDINDYFITGFVQDETGGDSDYQFFGNNTLAQFRTSGTTDPADSIVLQVSSCDIGDIFWTDSLSTQAVINFGANIVREPFGDGLYGLLYRRADVPRIIDHSTYRTDIYFTRDVTPTTPVYTLNGTAGDDSTTISPAAGWFTQPPTGDDPLQAAFIQSYNNYTTIEVDIIPFSGDDAREIYRSEAAYTDAQMDITITSQGNTPIDGEEGTMLSGNTAILSQRDTSENEIAFDVNGTISAGSVEVLLDGPTHQSRVFNPGNDDQTRTHARWRVYINDVSIGDVATRNIADLINANGSRSEVLDGHTINFPELHRGDVIALRFESDHVSGTDVPFRIRPSSNGGAYFRFTMTATVGGGKILGVSNNGNIAVYDAEGNEHEVLDEEGQVVGALRTSVGSQITSALGVFLQRSTTRVATADELAAIDVDSAGAIRFAYVTANFSTYSAGDLLVHNGTDWVLIANVAAADLANFLQRTGTNVANATELAAIDTAPNGAVAFARITATFGAYTQGDLLFHNGTDWVVISQATAVDLTNFLQRSATSVANDTQLSAIDTAPSGTVAFVRITAAFDTYSIGDLLFHNGTDWVVISQSTTVDLSTFLQRSGTGVSNATQLAAIDTSANGTVAFARVLATFGVYTQGDLLFHNGTSWVVISQSTTVDLSNFLQRSGTSVATANELSAIDTSANGTVAFARVTAAFSTYAIGDLLFHNGSDWVVISQSTTVNLATFLQRSVTSVNDATELANIAVTANGTIAFARVATTFSGHTVGTVLFHDGSDWQTLAIPGTNGMGDDGEDGRQGLNAVARTYTGTFVAQGDVDTAGEINSTDNGTTGTLTMFLAAADQTYWSNLSVGGLVTVRIDSDNYLQARITAVLGSVTERQYSFNVLDLVGTVNGSTGTAYVDSAAPEDGEDGDDGVGTPGADGRRGLTAVAETYQMTLRPLAAVDAAREAHWTDDGSTGTLTLYVATADTPYWENLTTGSLFTLRVDDDNYAQVRVTGSSGSQPIAYTFDVLNLVGTVNNRNGDLAYVDSAKSPRGRLGKVAVNRSITKIQSADDTPDTTQVRVLDNSIILNNTSTDIDADRLAGLPNGTPISLEATVGNIYRVFRTSGVTVNGDYTTISFTELDESMGAVGIGTEFLITFGDVVDGDDGRPGTAGRRGLIAVAESYQVTLRDLAQVDAAREAHWTDDGSTGTLTLYVAPADKLYWENLPDDSLFTLRVDDDNYAQARITGSSGNDPVAYTFDIIELIGTVNNRNGELVYVDSAKSQRGRLGKVAVNRSITRVQSADNTPDNTEVRVLASSIILNNTGTDVDADRLENLPDGTPISLEASIGNIYRVFRTSGVTVNGDYTTISFTAFDESMGAIGIGTEFLITFGDVRDGGITALVRSATTAVSDQAELDAIDVSNQATVALANVDTDFAGFRRHDLLFWDGTVWQRIYYIHYEYSHTGTDNWQSSRDDDEEYGRIIINGLVGPTFQLPNAIAQATTKLIKERDNIVQSGYIEFLQFNTWQQSVRFGNFPAHGVVSTEHPNVWKCVADRIRFVVNGVTDTNRNTLGASNDPGANAVNLTETVVVVDTGYNPDNGVYTASHNLAEQQADSITVNADSLEPVVMVDLSDSVNSEFVVTRDEYIRIRVVPTPAQTGDFHILGRNLRIAITSHTEIAPLEIEIDDDYLRAVDPSLPEHLRYQRLYQFSSERILGVGEDDLIVWMDGQSSRLGPRYNFGNDLDDEKIPLSGIVNENPYNFSEDIIRFIAANDVHATIDGGRTTIPNDSTVFELDDGTYDIFFVGDYRHPTSSGLYDFQTALRRIRYTGDTIPDGPYYGMSYGNDRIYLLQEDGTERWVRILNKYGDRLTTEDVEITANGNRYNGICVVGDEVLIGMTENSGGTAVRQIQRYSLDLGTIHGAFDVANRVTAPTAICTSGDRVHILDETSDRNGVIRSYSDTFQRYLGHITLPELPTDDRYRGIEAHPDGGFYVMISRHTGTSAAEIKRYAEFGQSLTDLDYNIATGRYHGIAHYPVENTLLALDNNSYELLSYNEGGHRQENDEVLGNTWNLITGSSNIHRGDIDLTCRSIVLTKTEQLYLEMREFAGFPDNQMNRFKELGGYLIIRRKRRQ